MNATPPDPATIDRLIRTLKSIVDDGDLSGLETRWQRTLENATPTEQDTVIRLCQWLIGERLRELLDNTITADGLSGIAAMCMHRVGLSQPARTGQLLADCTDPQRHPLLRHNELRRLPWVMSAVGVPTDIESARTPFITEWFATITPDTEATHEEATRAVIDSVARSAPAGWTRITGTLCAAAGIGRANLRLTRPEGDVGITAPIQLPALHDLKHLDTVAGTPWWCARIDITSTSATLSPVPADTPLDPIDLMRRSDYAADTAVTTTAPPPWLAAYRDTGLLDGRPILAPAAATERALDALQTTKVNADPHHVLLRREGSGYSVRALADGHLHTVIVGDDGTATTTSTTT